MARILRTEKRICPFCGHKYVRKVYLTDRGRGSICPKCHKRSDKATTGIGKWKAPKLKTCKNPDCNETFYANGRQKYCIDCGYLIGLKNRRETVRRYRARQKVKSNES